MTRAKDISRLITDADFAGTLTVGDLTASSLNGGQFGGRRNLLINSGFDIWQRGVSQTSAGYGSVDRFSMSNSTSSFTTTRQSFATGQTDVPNNPLYYLRCVVSSGGSAGNYMFISQAIEGVQNGAGQTVTLSFYAKASSALKVGVNLQQVFGTNGSSTVSTNGVAKTLSTSWARYTVTTTLPSISSKTIGTASDNLRLLLWLDSGSTYNTTSGSIGNQSGTFEFSNIQLEVSSVATPHERLSYGEELALCQRYYYRRTIGNSFVDFLPYAIAYATTDIQGGAFHPVQMRANPTLAFSGILKAGQGNAEYASADATAFTSNSTKDSVAFYTQSNTFSGLTQFRGYQIYGAANDYMELTAEL